MRNAPCGPYSSCSSSSSYFPRPRDFTQTRPMMARTSARQQFSFEGHCTRAIFRTLPLPQPLFSSARAKEAKKPRAIAAPLRSSFFVSARPPGFWRKSFVFFSPSFSFAVRAFSSPELSLWGKRARTRGEGGVFPIILPFALVAVDKLGGACDLLFFLIPALATLLLALSFP